MTSTEIWTSSAAINGYVVLKNGMQFGPFDVKSCSYQDFTNYDDETYRDLIPGPYGDQGNFANIPTSTFGAPVSVAPTTAPTTITVYDPADASPATVTVSTSAAPVWMDDVLGHTAPRFLQKKGTIYYFWNGAKDTSDVVFSCPKEFLPVFSKTAATIVV